MKFVALERADLDLKDLAKLVRKDSVILTRNGKPLASVRSVDGDDWESVSLANDPQFRRLIERSRRSYRKHGGATLEVVCRELGLDVAPGIARKRPKR